MTRARVSGSRGGVGVGREPTPEGAPSQPTEQQRPNRRRRRPRAAQPDAPTEPALPTSTSSRSTCTEPPDAGKETRKATQMSMTHHLDLNPLLPKRPLDDPDLDLLDRPRKLDSLDNQTELDDLDNQTNQTDHKNLTILCTPPTPPRNARCDDRDRDEGETQPGWQELGRQRVSGRLSVGRGDRLREVRHRDTREKYTRGIRAGYTQQRVPQGTAGDWLPYKPLNLRRLSYMRKGEHANNSDKHRTRMDTGEVPP